MLGSQVTYVIGALGGTFGHRATEQGPHQTPNWHALSSLCKRGARQLMPALPQVQLQSQLTAYGASALGCALQHRWAMCSCHPSLDRFL